MGKRELMIKAIEKKEFVDFLCGTGSYKQEVSQYIPGVEPTDTDGILVDAVYEEYKTNKDVKVLFEDALVNMLNGKIQEVYIALLYFMGALFDEKHELATFQLDSNKILPLINTVLKDRKNEMEKEIKFENSVIVKNAWKDVVRWNKICEDKYGVNLCII